MFALHPVIGVVFAAVSLLAAQDGMIAAPPPAIVVAAPTVAPPAPPMPQVAPQPPPAGVQRGRVDRAVWGSWAGLIECESGGDPAAVSGHGDFGLFQFRQRTWDGVARHLGRAELVGVWIPGQPVEVQFLFAETLRTMPGGGLSHWACAWAWGT